MQMETWGNTLLCPKHPLDAIYHATKMAASNTDPWKAWCCKPFFYLQETSGLINLSVAGAVVSLVDGSHKIPVGKPDALQHAVCTTKLLRLS